MNVAPLTDAAVRAASPLVRHLICGVAIAVLIAVAAGFLVAGLWMWLSAHYGAVVASMVIGFGLLAVAGCLGVRMTLTRKRQRQKAERDHAARAASGVNAVALADAFVIALRVGHSLRS